MIVSGKRSDPEVEIKPILNFKENETDDIFDEKPGIFLLINLINPLFINN